MVQTKQDVVSAVRGQAKRLREFGVRRCGVFGSFARGHSLSRSDVDLLVEFEPEKKTFHNFIHLAFFLEELLGRRVDLITLESLSPHIGPYILREVEYVPLGA